MKEVWKRRRGLPFVGAALLLVLVAAVAACGDDDDGDGGEPLLDPERAEELARSALPEPSDLPGQWTVTAEDEFDDDAGLPEADSEACQAIEALTPSDEENAAQRAGRANRELASTESPDALFPTSVEVEVNIFRDAEYPQSVFKRFQEALSTDDFAQCLEDAIREGVGPEATVETSEGEPSTAAPEGGEAIAYTITVAGNGAQLEMRMEGYIWRYSNAGMNVFILGQPENVTEEVVAAAVDGTQERLEGLAGD